MLAVLGGKQVALLVPTLVLAEQHRMNFARRMDGFPVSLASLTRARSSAESKEVREQLKRGTVDIVIGTHALFQEAPAFGELGLVLPLIISGVALVHGVAALKKLPGMWLVTFYLVLMLPYMMQFLVLLALIDSWYDFRSRLQSSV